LLCQERHEKRIWTLEGGEAFWRSFRIGLSEVFKRGNEHIFVILVLF
jgi:hypothetical protein